MLKTTLIIAGSLTDVWRHWESRKPRNFWLGLKRELSREHAEACTAELSKIVGDFRSRLDSAYHLPLPVQSAIDRFQEWCRATPNQPPRHANRSSKSSLQKLYRIDRFPDIARYHLYRHTYFGHATLDTLQVFDQLLQQMFERPAVRPTQMQELSDLQARLHDPADRAVSAAWFFPKPNQSRNRIEVLTIGESDHRHVIVRSEIADKHGVTYNVRAPLEPAEVTLPAPVPSRLSESHLRTGSIPGLP